MDSKLSCQSKAWGFNFRVDQMEIIKIIPTSGFDRIEFWVYLEVTVGMAGEDSQRET